ncbi:MAG: glycosyltransferase N-terminal domain-containing protein [Rhodospirillaceae bacterium]|nr:glycosyltransferase N-terminal domain-containing protein [Rhodospirillaceae bacterium]
MTEPLTLHLYGAMTAALRAAAPAWLGARARRGKEDPTRLAERYGRSSIARPPGPVVWCHAASIGEMQSVLPLLDRLARSGLHPVLTTGTASSARLFADAPLPQVIHQYAPLDDTAYVDAFLDHWRPAVAVRVESEIWPAAVARLRRRGVPLIIVNARLSPGAVRGWRRAPGLARYLFGSMSLVLAQTAADARAFADLGAPMVTAVGNLKAALTPLPADPTALSAITSAFADRPRWLAASIHPGEDRIVAEVHVRLRAAMPRVLTVVVPRHPDKAGAMSEAFRSRGLQVARRARGETAGPAIDVYMADTFGELGIFYRVCPVVFVGKTLAVGGGQNPIEPAQLGCALIWGPDMSNFPAEAAALEGAGGARRAAGAAELAELVASLLRAPETARAMGATARATVAADPGALARVEAALEPYVARALSPTA